MAAPTLKAFRYSVGLDVCGKLITAITGQPFDQFCQDSFFTPLNMVDTGFSVRTLMSICPPSPSFLLRPSWCSLFFVLPAVLPSR
jgi:CubicO group peptidase (beta-lactamase class C family)